jgi:hypothetical protein
LQRNYAAEEAQGKLRVSSNISEHPLIAVERSPTPAKSPATPRKEEEKKPTKTNSFVSEDGRW